MSEWDKINEQVKKSKIKRFPWKNILGCTITEQILRLRSQGLTSKQTIRIIMQNSGVKKYIESYPLDAEKLFDNIEISVCARYGENKSAEKFNQTESKELWKKIFELQDRIKEIESR